MNELIPVVLFAYARPAHLARTLAGLRENRVPRLLAFADGAKGPAVAAAVAETRALLRAVDWCEVRLVERPENLGLGRSILTGIAAVAAEHEAFIVFEDDLVCVPGTYDWMAAALRHFRDTPEVFSVTGWTHPRVTPAGVGATGYFDARAESWGWGGYARSWRGMNGETALEKMRAAQARGVSPDACGADLPEMAEVEARHNLWAVRWLYHHLLHGGLCLRPPVSLINHVGFDRAATNATFEDGWLNPVLATAPPAVTAWPQPVEHPGGRELWRAAYVGKWRRRWRHLLRRAGGMFSR